jgi:hypothetical protein
LESYKVEQLVADLQAVVERQQAALQSLQAVAERQQKALRRLVVAFARIERQVNARQYLAETGGDK